MFVMSFMTIFSVNAQVATENQKVFDNTYVSVNVGATTPMGFSEVFPLNTAAGLAVGKWFSPVWGAEVEGTAMFGSHDHNNMRFDVAPGQGHNFVRGHYVGVNGLVNLSNLFRGYKGTPRSFEVGTNVGMGWLHTYSPSKYRDDFNGIAMKTGLDFAFNLGKNKAHTVSLRPGIYWNLNAPAGGTMHNGTADRYLRFQHKRAQLYVGAAYTYHFKTSNGTRHFKTYDVGAMEDEIARLNAELKKKPKEVIKTVEVVKPVKAPVPTNGIHPGFGVKESVFFAYDSAELDDRAKETLDKLGENGIYVVRGYASIEGSPEYNKALSLRRAEAVAEYLRARGAKVDTVEGLGVVFGPTTGRVVIVTTK